MRGFGSFCSLIVNRSSLGSFAKRVFLVDTPVLELCFMMVDEAVVSGRASEITPVLGLALAIPDMTTSVDTDISYNPVLPKTELHDGRYGHKKSVNRCCPFHASRLSHCP